MAGQQHVSIETQGAATAERIMARNSLRR